MIRRTIRRLLRKKVKSLSEKIKSLGKYKYFILTHIGIPRKSDIPIEVCLVTIEKDFSTLKLCIESIRKYVKHPITKISILTKESVKMKEFCKKNHCTFIDETSVLGYGLEKFQDTNEANLKGREGWFFQQLLKLGFDTICEQEHYLVVDTDTVFLKSRIFKFACTTVFEKSDEWHIPYQNAYRKLMGFEYSSKRSFVVHCMLFEKTVLRSLKNYIESKHKTSWDNAIIKTADYSSSSFFSEYETYGNFFLRFHRSNMKEVYWFNLTSFDINVKENPIWAKSISYHSYLRPSIEPSFTSQKIICKIADFLSKISGEINTIFEFGSRYGEDTLEFAKKYPNAIIYSFECNQETLPICKQNISKVKNIILTEKAVSDEIGTVTFYSNDNVKTVTTWADGNQGASSLFKASGKYPVEQYSQKEIIVECTTLNAFVTEHKIPSIDLLWMDIQGAELKALKGLGDKLDIVKVMNIEVEFMEIYSGQPLFDEIKEFLECRNFRFIGFTTKGEYSADAVFVNKRILDCLDKKNMEKFVQMLKEEFSPANLVISDWHK